jgi:ubiquinone/menaquinone biosynthesis C-methylase UbiE
VLHHTPNTPKTINEVYRVLKPGGKTFIMLYHKRSFEFFTQIVRKMIHPSRWGWSLQDAVSYQTEMNKNASGPTNPLTKMYTQREVKEMFHEFKKVRTRIFYLRIPKLGRIIPEFMLYLPSRFFGWHVIIEAWK